MNQAEKSAPLRIDPEFRDKIPPLTADEFRQLEENIVRDGEIYEPIIVWHGVIVDGHNRYKIAQAHPEIPYRTKEMLFPDKWAAFDWMYSKQLGRRNLSDENRTYIIGKMYEARKKTQGGAQIGNQHARKHGAQNANDVSATRKPRTDEILAAEIGVNHSTVVRAEKFSKGVDAIRDVSPAAAEKILQGGAGVKKSEVQTFTQMPENEQKRFVEAVETGAVKERPKPRRNPNSDRGCTKEDREIRKKVSDAARGLFSDEGKTYTLELLLGDLEVNGAEYVRLLQNTITDHPELITEWNKPVIAETMQTIIDKITKVKETLL